MKKSSKILVFFSLVILFALPGFFAWFFYSHQNLLSLSTTNKGTLITPKLLQTKSTEDKWRIVLWQKNSCTEYCKNLIENLAKLRLALGRRLYNTELVILSDEKIPDEFAAMLRENDILFNVDLNKTDKELLGNESKIYLQNPQGYLILQYATTSDLKDVHHDIKHLLTQDE